MFGICRMLTNSCNSKSTMIFLFKCISFIIQLFWGVWFSNHRVILTLITKDFCTDVKLSKIHSVDALWLLHCSAQCEQNGSPDLPICHIQHSFKPTSNAKSPQTGVQDRKPNSAHSKQKYVDSSTFIMFTSQSDWVSTFCVWVKEN